MRTLTGDFHPKRESAQTDYVSPASLLLALRIAQQSMPDAAPVMPFLPIFVEIVGVAGAGAGQFRRVPNTRSRI